MPQLNPDPWFMTLVSTWLVFLIIIPPKVLAHCFPNEPLLSTAKKLSKNTWTWPWHRTSLNHS